MDVDIRNRTGRWFFTVLNLTQFVPKEVFLERQPITSKGAEIIAFQGRNGRGFMATCTEKSTICSSFYELTVTMLVLVDVGRASAEE